MAEPRYRYYVWEEDLVLTSSTDQEVFQASKAADIGDWQYVMVQFDTLDASAGQADGTFQCTMETCMQLGDYEAWQQEMYFDMDGSQGAVVIDFRFGYMGGWMRWKVKHAIAGTHWIRVRIKVLLKARASLDVARDRREAALAQQAATPLAQPTASAMADAAASEAAVRTMARKLSEQGLTVRGLLGAGVTP